MDNKQKPNGIVLTEAQKKSRRSRSIAIALALGVLVTAVLQTVFAAILTLVTAL